MCSIIFSKVNSHQMTFFKHLKVIEEYVYKRIFQFFFTLWRLIFLENVIVPQLLTELVALFLARRCITVITRFRYWTLSLIFESSPQPQTYSLRVIVILLTHLSISLSSCGGFRTKCL
jgi:hypothetical protein